MKKWHILVGLLIILMLVPGCFMGTSAPPGKLEIISDEMEETNTGVKVTVMVKNAGGNNIEFAEVLVRFFDAGKDLVNTDRDAVMNLGADEYWTFVLECSGGRCYQVKSYEIEQTAGTSNEMK